MSTKTFTDVAGQTITIQRPPDGYLVIADTNARHFVISKQLLLDSAIPVGELILDEMSKRAGA